MQINRLISSIDLSLISLAFVISAFVILIISIMFGSGFSGCFFYFHPWVLILLGIGIFLSIGNRRFQWSWLLMGAMAIFMGIYILWFRLPRVEEKIDVVEFDLNHSNVPKSQPFHIMKSTH